MSDLYDDSAPAEHEHGDITHEHEFGMADHRHLEHVSIVDLYEQANRLGEVLELSFWIQASGTSRDQRICGEVLISSDNEVVVCPEPWGIEHSHVRDSQREANDGASR